MKTRTTYSPILITGAERSGSTFIARVLDMCGVWKGSCNNMLENTIIHSLHYEILKKIDELFPDTKLISIPVNWKETILDEIVADNWNGKHWMVKGSFLAQYWPVWDYAFPDAKWLIVRRRTGDVIDSCLKTGYMKPFKNNSNLELLGFEEEKDGWLWWVHRYEQKFIEMMQAGLNCRVIWPERMVSGNFEQIYETVEWLGLKWNNKIPEVITPLLEKSRRTE